tara:strand:- start:310 stop:1017 length:708 start_codon:yes stop_codon:yes gene_type:complete
MGVTRPVSGTIITTTSITGMYDTVKSKVNTGSASRLDDAALGEQHLPSCIPPLDGTATAAADSTTLSSTATVLVAKSILTETESDVVGSNWQEILVLDNSGAGYTLPPCKVLVMMDATVQRINKGTTPNGANQAWFSVYYEGDIGAGSDVFWDSANMGMVTGNRAEATGLFGNGVNENVSIWFVIDKTYLVANWDLEKLIVRASCGYGAGASALKPVSILISEVQLSFCAFYKDE